MVIRFQTCRATKSTLLIPINRHAQQSFSLEILISATAVHEFPLEQLITSRTSGQIYIENKKYWIEKKK